MADQTADIRSLQIKKYANRRFYDTTRSQHVTLQDLHRLIVEGYELHITDSKTGEDITHSVLAQIILERDPLKLTLLPNNILHDMIRTQQELLGGVLENLVRHAVEAQRVSQERWSNFIRNTFGVGPFGPTTPLDWSRTFMDAFLRPAAGSAAPPRAPAPSNRTAEEEDLRRQVAELNRKLEELARNQGSNGR